MAAASFGSSSTTRMRMNAVYAAGAATATNNFLTII
jgi:hypothetical protein